MKNRSLSVPSEAVVPPPALASIEVAEFEGRIDPFDAFLRRAPEFLSRVKSDSSHMPESYRGFGVVALAFAYDFENNRYGVFTSGNFKAKLRKDVWTPDDIESVPKVCAEMSVVGEALEHNMTRVLGVFVAASGNRQKIQEVTGRATNSLHPCTECRDMLDGSPIVDKNTMVFTAPFWGSRFQFHTVGSLAEEYEKPESEFRDPNMYSLNNKEWEATRQKYNDELAKRNQKKLCTEDDPSRSKTRIRLARRAVQSNVTVPNFA